MTERSAETTQKPKRPIDMEIRVKYQHVESQQSKTHFQGLVNFLAEETRHNKQADRGEGEE